MTLLVSGATPAVREHDGIGVLIEPAGRGSAAGRLIPGRPWAMDNGAFSGLDVAAFLRMLRRFHGRPGCLFVTAPDVPFQADATLAQFRDWEPLLHARGWPVAFVGQDGLSLADVPWASCEAVFLGGSTDWKLGRVARDLAAYGQARGRHVHMGRVNSRRRVVYAKRIGCDSVDGSKWSRWSRFYMPTFAVALKQYAGGPLFEGI